MLMFGNFAVELLSNTEWTLELSKHTHEVAEEQGQPPRKLDI